MQASNATNTKKKTSATEKHKHKAQKHIASSRINIKKQELQ